MEFADPQSLVEALEYDGAVSSQSLSLQSIAPCLMASELLFALHSLKSFVLVTRLGFNHFVMFFYCYGPIMLKIVLIIQFGNHSIYQCVESISFMIWIHFCQAVNY